MSFQEIGFINLLVAEFFQIHKIKPYVGAWLWVLTQRRNNDEEDKRSLFNHRMKGKTSSALLCLPYIFIVWGFERAQFAVKDKKTETAEQTRKR